MRIMTVTLMFMVALVFAVGTSAQPGDAAFPGANGKIATTSSRDYSLGEIHLTNADGSRASHSTATVDQMSIDMSPDGNGIAAVGDRNEDALPDAEGIDTLSPGDTAGVCGNGLDDDLADSNGDTVPDSPDGAADDGCVETLTALERCLEIIVDGVINADEDASDGAFIDVTLGAQPGPAGGIPADRPLSAFQYLLDWIPAAGAADIMDVIGASPFFLIASGSTAQPFIEIIGHPAAGGFQPGLPVTEAPLGHAVVDGGVPHEEVGPGVLTRLTIEGHDAGVAQLVLADDIILILDDQNEQIPLDAINNAFLAVSKDLDGDTTVEVIGDLGKEEFTCIDSDGDAFPDDGDNCSSVSNPNQADFDDDGLGDACDPDDDDDGVADEADECPTQAEDADGFEDTDGCPDPDNDGDGVTDANDNCSNTPNANQANTDGDDEGDVCDLDDDNDGVPDSSDNCDLLGNPGQADFNQDGEGDDCDDSDGDGISDQFDNCDLAVNPGQQDFDSDGKGDHCDDSDGDGVLDAFESPQALPKGGGRTNQPPDAFREWLPFAALVGAVVAAGCYAGKRWGT
jgi:hypothetical protein